MKNLRRKFNLSFNEPSNKNTIKPEQNHERRKKRIVMFVCKVLMFFCTEHVFGEAHGAEVFCMSLICELKQNISNDFFSHN